MQGKGMIPGGMMRNMGGGMAPVQGNMPMHGNRGMMNCD